ncbi:MAG TPA: hypothetical protein VFC00_28500 [Micromonosporaceae bacterium]|nr:hypothetical protein [Micromonosporaceae bacterium]
MDGLPAQLTDRLYTGSPDGFIAARDAAVAAAKEAGDTERAKAIAKLRKPTIAAWLVNLLAIEKPELVEELGELAAAMRSAQRDLRGAELRELATQRREVVGALVAQARTLAVAANPALKRAKLPLAEVEETLTAALASPEAAELVSSGRLVKTIEYSGIGEVPRPQLRVVADPAPSNVERRSAEEVPEKRIIERELAAARTEEEKARADLARAEEAEHDGVRVLEEADAALAEAQQLRAAADEELSRRKLARKTAERTVSTAVRRVGAAEAVLAELDVTRGKDRRTG